MRTMIDPPLGHRYGFPKQIPTDVEDRTQWILDQGYPEKYKHLLDYCGIWEEPDDGEETSD